jgi:acyl-homoserine-lactone acylase
MRGPLVLFFAFSFAAFSSAAAPKAEILWDKYGTPHIFAPNIEEMFYAHGWAQMHNHADLLLRLYGESRGRGAEYWGEDKLALDRWVHTNGVPARAKAWYEAQKPEFRRNLDAFARGINDYAKAHPEHASPAMRQVLPVSGVDVVGHSLRAVHYMYMGSMTRLQNEVGAGRRRASNEAPRIENRDTEAGSNTWTVGPSRSASKKAMLIINPHLAWDGFYTYMEVHLVAPGYDLYGAPQIGFPTPVIGFNRHAGWGRTVNTIDTVDFYRLKVKGNQYEFDGVLRDFQTREAVVRVKQADGTMREERFRVRESVHGPVVFAEGEQTIAMRVAGIDRPLMLEQWFRMGGAKNLAEFQAALRMQSVPMWNANYADDQGHIYLVMNGTIPRRSTGDWAFWSKPVPGDTSRTLWNDYLRLEELPQSLDPKSGFNQNANEAPWLTTLPQLDPAKFPKWIAPPPERPITFRTKRSLRMISEDRSITYEELLGYKHNTRAELADAVLPDLLPLADKATNPLTKKALAVLAAWDRHLDTGSRGAVLFQLFADRYFGSGDFMGDRYRIPYNPQDPLHSAEGIGDPAAALAALEQAAANCQQLYGALDVPYGEVFRFQRGTKDLPGNGGAGRLGLFRTMTFGKRSGNKFYPTHGETFVCAIEFGKPQKAQCLLGYGNSSQAGSPHVDDQLPLMVEKKLHPVWRERKEIEANLERREQLR